MINRFTDWSSWEPFFEDMTTSLAWVQSELWFRWSVTVLGIAVLGAMAVSFWRKLRGAE